MTRINKSAFKVREKLTELGRRFGLKGSELMKSETAQDARDLVSAGRKNMIINGACNINQRYTGSTTVPNATGGTYVLDRWAVNEATGGSVSVNMDGDPYGGNGDGSDVQEFSKAMQIAVQTDNSSLSANENLHFFQNIEGYNTTRLGWGTPGAKPATLSFWVRSNVPGTYCVGLENNAVNKTCIREYTVNPGFKWQKVVLTFPGPIDGTWEVTNSVGIRVRFCLASGTQYDDGIDGQWVVGDELTTGNQVNFVSSTSNRYFITGVQLEVGKNATDFEHRSYGEELALCQRYYQKSSNAAVGSFHTSTEAIYNTSWNYSTTSWTGVSCQLPVEMRATPSVTLYTNNSGASASAGYVGHYQVNINWGACAAAAGNQTNTRNISVSATSPGRGATGSCLILWNFTAEAEL